MSAHEWTRARQRSVRHDAPAPHGPDRATAEPVRAEPEPAPDTDAEPPVSLSLDEPEPAPEPAPEATPAAETAPPEPAPPPAPEPAAPAPTVSRRPRRPPQGRPMPRQAELPLGLEPTPEPPPRPATETREELIERLLDPHLTLQETAKVLDVCPTTVRRYTNRGLLAHYRTPGNQRRFRLSDVLAFMERQGIPAHGLERQRPRLPGASEGEPDDDE